MIQKNNTKKLMFSFLFIISSCSHVFCASDGSTTHESVSNIPRTPVKGRKKAEAFGTPSGVADYIEREENNEVSVANSGLEKSRLFQDKKLLAIGFKHFLRSINLAEATRGKFDIGAFKLIKQRADLLFSSQGIDLVNIGNMFNSVANEYSDHDYVSGGENFRMLTDQEMQIKYANWQKWYTYKLFASHYLKQNLTEDEERLCNKELIATEFIVPLANSLKEEIEAKAETFYGQQIKMKRVIDRIFREMLVMPSVLFDEKEHS